VKVQKKAMEKANFCNKGKYVRINNRKRIVKVESITNKGAASYA